MKWFLLCLPAILLMLITSSGQNNAQHDSDALNYLTPIPKATWTGRDTVTELGNNIMVIYQDKKNKYWFGSWENGLYTYDGKTILHYTTKSGLPHNRVEDIQEDKWGNIFINTTGGLCKFDGNSFTNVPVLQSDEWKLEPGDLWFKSLQFAGKVYRYDGKDLHCLPFPGCKLGEEWIAKHPTYPSPYGIYTIYKDSKGNVWFGTAAVGACRYNGKTFDWILEDDVTELHYNPSNGIRSIIEDKDGYFWFNSAYRYDVYGKSTTQKSTFYTREKSIGNLDGRPDSDFWEYMSIARDNNNNLWIATYWNGVWRYDGKKTEYYPVQAGGEDITMFYIYKDNHDDLWLGTHENGAYKFNGTAFERFNPIVESANKAINPNHDMAIKAIIEPQAHPGKRDELKAFIENLVAKHGPGGPGFIKSTRYEVLDNPDKLIEIADWESAEAREAHMKAAAATGIYAPLKELLAEPFRVTIIKQMDTEMKKPDRQIDEADIRKTEAAYDLAWKRGDIEGIMACFTNDAVLISPRGDVATGKEQVRNLLSNFLGNEAKNTKHTSRITRVSFVTDDVAVVDGEAFIEGSENLSTSDKQHSFTDILVRTGNGWLISQIRAHADK